MTKTIIPILGFVLISLISCKSTPKESDPESVKIDRLVSAYQSRNRFNGSLLVAKDGLIILSKGYGYANMEWNVPNTSESRFLIASISKVFTATLIAKLIDQGKLDLETPLSAVLPWYRKDIGDKVTICHLLNHTSGIPNYLMQKNKTLDEISAEFGTGAIDKLNFAEKYCSSDLEFEPGSQWKYNNSAYFLLGLIIEKITGKPYHVALQEMILDPLKMESSGDIQPDPQALVKNLVTGYVKNFDEFSRASYWNLSTTYAAGSLYSTPEDLLKFDRALYTDTFVSSKSKQAMFTMGLHGYGCGWELREAPIGNDSVLKKIQTHEGYLRAWHTRLYRIPEDGYCIVILSNTGDAPLESIFTGITDILYGRIPRQPKKSVGDVLNAEFKINGIESAVKLTRNLIEMDSLDKNESELNRLGYNLMNSKRTSEAVSVFQLNTQLFPESWNVWDSYGESLATAERIPESINAYEKSLQLNPASLTGKMALAGLKARK